MYSKPIFARILALLMLLLGAVPAVAQTPHPPTPVADAGHPAPVIAHPALWRVQRGATTIYLFGTVHALPPGVQWYGGAIAEAFGHADTLITEILDRPPAEMRAIVAADAMLPPGQSLRALMSPADARALARDAARYGMPPAMFDRFQPWYAAIALSTLPLMRSGYDPADGVDAQLAAKAKAVGRTHEALETAEGQLGLFAGLPMAVQKRYLHEVLHNLPSLTKELSAVILQWERGDAVRLAKLMNADEDDPLLRQKLLIDRNKAWAKWIAARLDRPGNVFIAVGAGHLAGADSVQAQLAVAGIKVTRVQ